MSALFLGRNHEQQLFQKKQSAVREGTPQYLYLIGESGIGKTRLVEQFLSDTNHQHELHFRAKYSPGHYAAPYFGWIEILRQFISWILQQPKQDGLIWKKLVQSALSGSEGIIIDFIPELGLLLETVTQTPDLEYSAPTDKQTKTASAFLELIRLLGSINKPVILFIDDLQWADASTIQLLNQIKTDDTLHYCFFITASRPTPSSDTTLDWEPLYMDGFSKNDIEGLLIRKYQTLSCDTADLAHLLEEKTGGNPFYIHQILEVLESEGALQYMPDEKKWQASLKHIQTLNITENVASLLETQFTKLPPDSVSLLSTGACMGSPFSVNLLAQLSGKQSTEIIEDLTQPMLRQWVNAIDSDSHDPQFQFLHDRLLTTVYANLSHKEKTNIHTAILKKKLEHPDFDKNEFGYLAHIQDETVKDLSSDLFEKLSHLVISIAEKMKNAGDYQKGIQLLKILADGIHPETHLYTPFFLEYSELFYLVGEYEEAERYFNLLLTHTTDPVDRCKIRTLRSVLYTSKGLHQDALQEGLVALEEVGIRIPQKVSKIRANLTLLRVAFQFGVRSQDTLYTYKQTQEPIDIAVSTLFCELAAPSYFVDNNLYTELMSRANLYFIKKGFIPQASSLIVAFCICFTNRINHYYRVETYFELARKLSAGNLSTRNEAKLFNAYSGHIRHWVFPVLDNIPILDHAITAGLRSGDRVYAAAAILNTMLSLFVGGSSLQSLSKFIQEKQVLFPQIRLSILEDYFKVTHKVLKDLGFDTPEGPLMASDSEIAQFIANKNVLPLGFYYVGSLLNSLITDNPDNAYSLYKQAEPLMPYAWGMTTILEFECIGGLILCEKLKHAHPSEHASLKKELNQRLHTLKRRVRKGPNASLTYRYWLILAEKASLENQPDSATSYYNKALKTAKQQTDMRYQGLILERMAEHFIRINMIDIGNAVLKEAYTAYLKWGSKLKCDHLERKHPHITFKAPIAPVNLNPLIDTPLFKPLPHTSSTEYWKANIQTILNHAERLLKTEKIILVRIENGQFYIVGEKSNKPVPNSLDSHFRRLESEASKSIFKQTILKKETLYSDAPKTDIRFKYDFYLTQTQPKGFISMPLVNKDEVIGILYIEKENVGTTIGQADLGVIRLLATQTIISLEHTRVSSHLEQTQHELANLTETILRQEREKARMAEKERSTKELIYFITHEVKNTVYATGHLLKEAQRESYSPEMKKTLLQTASDECYRLSAFSKQYLFYEQLHLGQSLPENETLSFTPLIDQILATHNAEIRQKNIRIDRNLNSDSVLGSPKLFPHLLGNLIHNAIKYSDPNSTVKIESEIQDSQIHIKIWNQSDPIAPEKLERLFLLFNSTPDYDGQPVLSTGLGLAISKKIAALHGGKITLSSTETEGTTVTVSLPHHSH